MKSIILSLLTFLLCYHCSSENDFATGEQAYLSGDYHSAMNNLGKHATKPGPKHV